jgi:prevent-host-death family protein
MNKTIFSIKFSPTTQKGENMTPIKNIKPISYIKANAAKVLDHVCESRAPYIVTQNGEARGVILDVDTYQKMQDGLKLFKLFAQSEGEVARGRVIHQKDLFDSLESELIAK